MKQLAAAGDHDKIAAVITLLKNEYTLSPQANHRKVLDGFCLGLVLDFFYYFAATCSRMLVLLFFCLRVG